MTGFDWALIVLVAVVLDVLVLVAVDKRLKRFGPSYPPPENLPSLAPQEPFFRAQPPERLHV